MSPPCGKSPIAIFGREQTSAFWGRQYLLIAIVSRCRKFWRSTVYGGVIGGGIFCSPQRLRWMDHLLDPLYRQCFRMFKTPLPVASVCNLWPMEYGVLFAKEALSFCILHLQWHASLGAPKSSAQSHVFHSCKRGTK